MSISSSALQAEQYRMASAAHGIANSQTPGFKAQRVELEDAAPGVRARAAGLDTRQGPLAQTGQPFDLAVEGGGYFQVRTPDGQTALTRDGTFSPDATGRLVHASGATLDPPLTIPTGTDPSTVSVAPTGAVSAGGVSLGAIQVVDVPAPDGLMPNGANLYATTIASGAPTPAPGARIQQGAIEQSNVDLVSSTVDVLASEHAFTANVRALEVQDEMLRAVLQIGQ